MAKRALADVLWKAANKYLSTSEESTPRIEWGGSGLSPYSCDALFSCLDAPNKRILARRHLEDMGCPVESTSCFQEFEEGMERQGVRYMWLLLAMHVAQDEQIYIEV